MASIRARTNRDGTTRFQAEVRLRGHPRLVKTFPNRTLAKEWAKQIEAEIVRGHLLPRIEASRHTVHELLRRFIAEGLDELSPGSRAHRIKQLEWWAAQVGHLTLDRLTPAAVSGARLQLLKRVSPATSNRYIAGLSAAINMAIREWSWMESNPVSKVRRKRESRGRVRFLSDEERQRLLVACRESSCNRLYPLVLFALTTGARQGELMSLRWKDVDLSSMRATLHDTKNRERRAIYFHGPAAEVLRDMSKTPHISGKVFASRSGEAVFPNKHWYRALRMAEIEDFRFHDLRHTAASYLAMSGATLAEIAEFLGHKTLSMVKRYAHLSQSHSSSVARRMVDRFLSS